MRKFAIPGLVVAAAVALVVLLVYGVSNHTDTASIDAKVARGDYPVAPGYRTPMPLLGSSRSSDLAAYHGKLTVVNIYASWCVACHAEAKLMAREQQVLAKHGDTIVGVTWRDSSSSSEKFNHEFGVRYPVLRDVSGNFARGLGTYQIPETFVLNGQGKIVALERNQISQQWLNQNVNSRLGGSA